MWIFLNNSFLSIVQHRDKPDHKMVRARLRGDIDNVFPDAEVVRTPQADYLYRATIPTSEVSAVLAKQIEEIDYDNFKNSVKDFGRARNYGEVWRLMYDYQNRKSGEYK
jgi:hypothetical protein